MPRQIVDKEVQHEKIIGEPQTEFPWDAVPADIKNYCLVMADLNCNDPVAIFTHLLPTIGVLIGADTWCHAGKSEWYNPAILQTMNVGAPSRGKSTAIRLGTAPIKHLDEKLFEEYRKEYEDWQRKYDEATGKEKQHLYENMPIRKECECENINYETIVSELSLFPSQLLHVDEGGGFFENLKTGQKDNLTPFNSLWNGRCASSKRRNGKIKIDRHINVNTTIGIQPELLKRLLNTDRIKNSGFSQRFLFCWSDAELPPLKREYKYNSSDNQKAKEDIDTKAMLLVERHFELRKKYNEHLIQGGNPWKMMCILEIRGKASDRLGEFADAIKHSKKYAEYGSKVGSIISRIALVLTVWEKPKIENGGLIELSEIESAIKIWKFYLHKYTELFNGNDELEGLQSSILNFVEKKIKPFHPHISEARIWKNFSKRLTPKGRPFFDKALENLVKEGLLAVECSTTKSKLYTIPKPE